MTELWWLVPVYLFVINAVTYLAFWVDKKRAQQRAYRIAEHNLLALAIRGEAPAAIFAQQYLRHKTKKQPFATKLFFVPPVQVAAAIALALS